MACLCVVGSADFGDARAQSYTLEWSVVVPGGGMLSGAGYTMMATAGQPAAGVLAGGDYTVLLGYWPVPLLVEVEPGPALVVQWAPGFAVISWASDASGFVLEETDDLGNPNWRRAPLGNPAIIPTSAAARYYRLVKP